MIVREATHQDLDILAPLFNGYRVFYKQTPDILGAKKFLEERILKKESRIYIAFSNEASEIKGTSPSQNPEELPLGFTQIYPIFSSVTMEPMYLLNDLYIIPTYRGKGYGTALINCVKKYCKLEQQKGIVIQTEKTNPAQKLYESLGFKKDPDLHYFWPTN